jgi:ornithine cyclodeaminase/alanine dehydrogenase-like protein (mu-crystallin family)
METLLITREQAIELLDLKSVVPALKDAFIRHPQQASRPLRVRADIPGTDGTATVLFPGMHAGTPAYSVKVHAKFLDQQPAIRGVLCLHSLETGQLLAVMDSTYLTAVRTGLAGAMAADVLACADSDTVAVIGAGVQGRHQLASLARLRHLSRVTVYDIVPAVSERFSSEMSRELDVAIEPMPSVADAVRDMAIVLMATWAREPLIHSGMLAAGSHVTTLGADEPGKVEVSAEVIRHSLFFCDDAELAAEMGALAGAGLGGDAVEAELGTVLAGLHPGRTSAEQVTIYGGVGLAFQDAVCAWAIYEAAKARGVGQSIDFLR